MDPYRKKLCLKQVRKKTKLAILQILLVLALKSIKSKSNSSEFYSLQASGLVAMTSFSRTAGRGRRRTYTHNLKSFEKKDLSMGDRFGSCGNFYIFTVRLLVVSNFKPSILENSNMALAIQQTTVTFHTAPAMRFGSAQSGMP